MKSQIKSVDNTKALDLGLSKLKKTDVLVGIPQKSSSRQEEGEKITNAELLFVHTNGSPLRNIPARPVIEPAIQDKPTRYAIMERLKSATLHALDGDYDSLYKELEMAGMIGQNASRAWFTNPKNGWAPNSPATIKAKGSDKPLIDTGTLRKSIIYIVRRG